MMQSAGAPEKVLNIQALRFLAALLVVLFHTKGHYEASGGTWLFAPFQSGWLGVDIFFVISGFIMWHVTRGKSGPAYAGRFAYKRFVRIYSGFLPWLLVMVALYLIFTPQRLDAIDLVKSTLLIPQAHSTNILSVSWTLSYELLFYAGFALILLASRRWTVPLLIGAGAIIVAAMFQSEISTRFVLSPLVLEFIAGALLAAYLGTTDRRMPIIGVAVALVGFTIGILYATPGDRLARTLTMGVGSVGLVYAAVSLEALGRSAPQWMVRYGDASYALYLCHIPLLFLVRWTLREDFATAPEIAYSGVVIVAVAISVLWFKYYERPVYEFLASARLYRKRRSVAA